MTPVYLALPCGKGIEVLLQPPQRLIFLAVECAPSSGAEQTLQLSGSSSEERKLSC